MIVHFILTFIILVLNLYPIDYTIRKNKILPFSFVLIGLFMGLRYNYGLDYWNYYNEFYHPANYRPQEFLFWFFFHLFGEYYQYILVKSLLLVAVLFYFVRKYVPVKYYSVFFFLFMIHPSLIYSMMTAERTCVGAMVLWCCMEFFYFKKYNVMKLVLSIFFASLFHTTLLIMLVIPILDFMYRKHKLLALAFLVFSLIISMYSTEYMFELITSSSDKFEHFNHYMERDRFYNSSVSAILYKSVLFVPLLFLMFPPKKLPPIYEKFVVLAICYLFAFFVGLESDGRIGLMLIPFFVIALTIRASLMRNVIWICVMLLPLFAYTIHNNQSLYNRMYDDPLLPGNYLKYETIFSSNLFH